MDNKKIRKAARVVLFDEDGKTPIMDVRYGEYYKIPGGGVEEGETDEQAAIREAREECGCEIKILEKISEQEFADPNPGYEDIIHHSVCYLAEKIGEKNNPEFDEHEKNNKFQLKWVSFDEAVKLFESSNTDDILARLINKRDLKFLKRGKELFDKKYK